MNGASSRKSVFHALSAFALSLLLSVGGSAHAAGEASRTGDKATRPAQMAQIAQIDRPDQPSLAVMAGQMIMVGFRGADVERDAGLLAPVREDIRLGRVGGVILFDRDALTNSTARNVESLEQVRMLSETLQRDAALPLFVAVDQEGGRVRRFKEVHGVPETPSPEEMGKGDPRETRQQAEHLAGYLALAGVNVNFAPSLDVNINPDCPAIGALSRSFSEDSGTVAVHGAAFAEGLWTHGVIPAYKHFPGHGSSTQDTHKGLTDVTGTWSEKELEPYHTLLENAPPAMVMVAHVVNRDLDERYPATLSRATVTGLLREKTGWSGVVITDDLNMAAISDVYTLKESIGLAINAGIDIVLFGNNLAYDPHMGRQAHRALLELAAEGVVPEERIRQSYDRIMRLKSALPEVQGKKEAQEPGPPHKVRLNKPRN